MTAVPQVRRLFVVTTVDGCKVPVGMEGDLVTVGGALRFAKPHRTALIAALLLAERECADPDQDPPDYDPPDDEDADGWMFL